MPERVSSADSPANQLTLALDHAGKGYRVIPLRPQSRTPYKKGWTTLATTDPKTIHRWWNEHPDAIPGIATGNGVGVLDIDRKKGKDGFKTLRAKNIDPEELDGFRVTTPTGGRHLIYRDDGGLRNSQGEGANENSREKGLGEGLDTRGRGGYIAAPGAVAHSGRYKPHGELPPVNQLPPYPDALRPRARTPAGGRADDFEPTGLSTESLRDALMAIPLDVREDCWGTNHDWVKVGRALYDETGGSEEGRDLWHDWSADWGGYDHDEADAVWKRDPKGYTGQRATLWPLIREAERHGYELPEGFGYTPEEAFSDAVVGNVVSLDDWRRDVTSDDWSDLIGTEPPAGLETDQLFPPASRWDGKPIPAREWYLKGWIPKGVVAAIYGPPGHGKTLLAMQLAAAGAAGTDFIGLGMPQPGPVFYLAAEDDEDDLHRRTAAIARGLDVRLADLEDFRIVAMTETNPVLARFDQRTGRVRPTKLYDRIEAEVARVRPALIVLDTLANLFAGNENDRAQVTEFVGLFRAWAAVHGCSVVILAHPSKSGMASGRGDSGSTAWEGAVRARLYFERPQADSGDTVPEHLRVFSRKKLNAGPLGEGVEVYYRDGRFVGASARDQRSKAENAERVFLAALDQLAEQGRAVSPSKQANNFAPSVMATMAMAKAAEVGKAQLAQAMARLFDRRELRVEGQAGRGQSIVRADPFAEGAE